MLLVLITINCAGVSCKLCPPRIPNRISSRANTSIPNLHQLHAKLFSGGEPQGISAFKTLKELGVQTIVSVDGAKPDVVLARTCGLKYIHLPIGYAGIEASKAVALGNIARTVSGSVFVHCHHGKHRGPAAACIVAMGAGFITADQSVDFMKLAGTGRSYPGLWRDVAEFHSLKQDVLAAPYLEIAPIDPFVESMGAVDKAMDQLEHLHDGGTLPQTNQMAGAAQLLIEGFKESSRHLRRDAADGLKFQLSEAEQAAVDLQRSFSQGNAASAKTSLHFLKELCVTCHQRFRNPPM
jgi:hypothetical protein